jgi:hypothetical protein
MMVAASPQSATEPVTQCALHRTTPATALTLVVPAADGGVGAVVGCQGRAAAPGRGRVVVLVVHKRHKHLEGGGGALDLQHPL